MSFKKNQYYPNSNSIFHIGLIADGVRRWSKKNNLSLTDGYEYYANKVFEFINLLIKLDIPCISVYGSSIQNFQRTEYEVECFCNSHAYLIDKLLIPIQRKHNISISFVGDINVLPENLKKEVSRLNNSNKYQHKIYLLFGYNPIDEILHAVKNTTNGDIFINNLLVKEPLDIVIRSGGAKTLSNFLPIQSAYARLYFIDKLFPDVEVSDYQNIISEFYTTGRKYGD